MIRQFCKQNGGNEDECDIEGEERPSDEVEKHGGDPLRATAATACSPLRIEKGGSASLGILSTLPQSTVLLIRLFLPQLGDGHTA